MLKLRLTPGAAQGLRACIRDEPSENPNRDPNIPRLRRGKPDSTARRDVYTAFDDLPDASRGTVRNRPKIPPPARRRS